MTSCILVKFFRSNINSLLVVIITSLYTVVASVEGKNKFTTYEQNAEQGQIVAKYSRTWGLDFPHVTSIVRK